MNAEEIHEIITLVIVALLCPLCVPLVIHKQGDVTG